MTTSDVKDFQRSAGIKVDGIVGPQTVSVLKSAGSSSSFDRTLRIGSTGNDVEELQKKLKTLGHFTFYKTTNYYGTITADAVKSFQRANGLTADGIAGSNTFHALNKKSSFMKPTSGTLTAKTGMRWGSRHTGVDIAKAGTVSVVAAASGTVERSYYSSTYGNVVFIAHSIGGQKYTTVYAHMRERKVSAGQRVSQGQLLGHQGNTGDSYGQHLHFELHKGSWNINKTNMVDPLDYITL
ncbi:hypothetical protein FCL54_17555 [Pseudalkalibacillus caeni]|uniref:Peptidase M23 n=1 Tax=Exobacillus caeni TaxID=2574798 RepID=A0A5R9F6D2_9BACL|nr:hypothetical protein FCL54_17555 [Pseudalkalibacillus caeni]